MLKDEIHVINCLDERSGIRFEVVFDNLDDCVEFLRFYRSIKVGWIEPVYSFGFDPINDRKKYKECENEEI